MLCNSHFGHIAGAFTKFICLLLAAGALVSCNVASSRHFSGVYGANEVAQAGCKTEFGSYLLPRTVLNIKILEIGGNFVLQTLQEKRIPDNRHVYCFDHLRSALAQDTVRMFKTKIEVDVDAQTASENTAERTPYLQLVASRAVDHTAGIIRNIIRAAFILISSNPEFTPARAGSGTLVPGGDRIVADFQVDPFDHVEMAELNRSVRRYGFCFVLESYTFNRSTLSPDQYCHAPGRKGIDNPPKSAEAIKEMRYLVPKPTSGIFYRPRAPYQLSVYIKHLPDNPGPWQLRYLASVQLENIMPIVSVGIKRAAFATRRTGLVFDDGMLTDVCVSKGSELEGAIEIPLDVIYGIVALPGEVIRATYNDVNTKQQLLQKQTELIKAQNQYIAFLNNNGTEELTRESPTALQLNGAEDGPTDGITSMAATEIPSIKNAPPDSEKLSDATLKSICPALNAAGDFGLDQSDESSATKVEF